MTEVGYNKEKVKEQDAPALPGGRIPAPTKWFCFEPILCLFGHILNIPLSASRRYSPSPLREPLRRDTVERGGKGGVKYRGNAGSSNGRTADSGSAYRGPNPCPATNINEGKALSSIRAISLLIFAYHYDTLDIYE